MKIFSQSTIFIKRHKKAIAIILIIFLVIDVLTGVGIFTTSKLKHKNKSDFVSVNLEVKYNRDKLDKTIYTVPPNPISRALNIVFVSESFYDKNEFMQEVSFVKSALTSVEPFKSHQAINFFSVYSGAGPEICKVETKDQPKPKLTCTTKVNDYILPLGLIRFKAVIISRQSFTSWSNVARLNNTMVALSRPITSQNDALDTKIFQHEFAHGFGLKDEMTKSVIAAANSQAKLPDGPNCVPDAKLAIAMWGDMVTKVGNQYIYGDPGDVGFYKGCAGNENYIKPAKFSLMNLDTNGEGSDKYGKVSEEYLKQVLKYCYTPTVYKLSNITNQADKNFFDYYPEYQACVK